MKAGPLHRGDRSDRRQRPEESKCASTSSSPPPLVALVVPSTALADVTNNGTTNDAQGYCIANHLHNGWSADTSFNGDRDGIGWIRSEQTGKAISGSAGNRVPVKDCITDQGIWSRSATKRPK